MTNTQFKYKVGDELVVKSGKLYRIMNVRHACDYREDGYSAVQVRDGKLYGPTRVFKEDALRWPFS